MEVTGNDVKGKMHLLISGHFESKDLLYQCVEHVYRNFTSIHKACIALLDELEPNSPEEDDPFKVYILTFITFCRCSLNRIVGEDGITIHESRARLLAEIELLLLDFIRYLRTSKLSPGDDSDDENPLYGMGDLLSRIEEAYSEPSPIYCYRLIINYDLMMEFLRDLKDKDEDVNIVFLRNYLESLTKDRIHDDSLDKWLITVENIAYKMACHSFFLQRRPRKFDSNDDETQSGFHVGVLKTVLVLQSEECIKARLMSDELVIGYVKCVQDHLMKLLEDNMIDLTVKLKGQLMNLHEGLTFLMHLLITYPLKHDFEQEKLSNIRLDFQSLARNVGSAVCSFIDNPEGEEMSLEIFDLIQKIDVIEGQIIETICCTVLREPERESPKKDQLHTLILLLQKLKEFMDREPDLSITWKDHKNLVLFIFYLVQNNIRGGNHIGDDDFSRNILHLDVALIEYEELNEVLVSAQVVAFNMASYSLLRRYGGFHWSELYSYPWSRTNINIHMCIGILKAIVLSSTTPLTYELLNAYARCIEESLIELLHSYAFDPADSAKDQLNVLHEGFSFLWRFLINYKDEPEKVSHIKIGFQDLARSLGSEVCSCFCNWLRADMAKQNTVKLSQLVDKMNPIIDKNLSHISVGFQDLVRSLASQVCSCFCIWLRGDMAEQTIKLSQLVEKMNPILFETEEIIHLVHINRIGRESPKTNQLGSLNLLLENWKGLMECESDLIITWRDQFQMIHENLVLFKSFLTSNSSMGDDESQKLCSSILDAGHVAEYLLTTFSVGTCPAQCRDIWILDFTKHVELIKATVVKVKETKDNVKEISRAGKDRSQLSAPILVPTPTDAVVGFEVEMELIRRRLTACPKQLDVISIVGMPGLGKTTLARKIYEESFTIEYFDVRAWCGVSQEYNKKHMLLAILGCVINLTDEIKNQSEVDLSVRVHKELIGRRYFIVLDDIWDINAFMYLKRFFPDNKNGSRIMLTSRSKIIGSQAQCNGDIIEPSILTDEQSWDLLKLKVYNEGKCPPELLQIGMEIAKKCRGLPLAIVVVGGVLATDTHNLDFWEQVRGSLSSYLARDSQSQFLAALELSYEFLPDCLKPMFLYIGAFPEDKEIHVDKLLPMWVAEGFVQKMDSTSLEIEAEANLMDLIDRSLVMVARRRSTGRVKACHVHDLLRDMCLAKAVEEKFMLQVNVSSELPDPVMYQWRVSIFIDGNEETTSRHLAAYDDLPNLSITPPIYSLLFFNVGEYGGTWCPEFISNLTLLKVLDADILTTTQGVFNKILTMLVHLRYLSILGGLEYIPSSISRLRSLETLIIRTTQTIHVPETIWEMSKLRHLYIGGFAKFSAALENSFVMENLETLSELSCHVGKAADIFRKVPGLKTLRWKVPKTLRSKLPVKDQLPNFESLGKLESLNLTLHCKKNLIDQLKLPLTLKKLNLAGTNLRGNQISTLKTLPNLEVLKLSRDSFVDERWDMGDDDVFTNLKFLKLDYIDIKRWTASAENFPRLEKLIMEWCVRLEEIPSDLGDFFSLRKIKVLMCTGHLEKLVKEIQTEQEDYGNESLKFYFYKNIQD